MASLNDPHIVKVLTGHGPVFAALRLGLAPSAHKLEENFAEQPAIAEAGHANASPVVIRSSAARL
jgi:hypothetical protein